jgi:general nucleoside transport system permease protein
MRNLINIVLSIAAAFVIALVITLVIYPTLPPGNVFALPVFPGVMLVNVLVGGSLVLFFRENGLAGTLRIVLTVLAALVLGFVVMAFLSSDPVRAMVALVTGPLSRLNRWGNWIEDALSLILVGLAIALVFRARLFSLGAEGQILLAAAGAGLLVLNVQGIPQGLLLPLAAVVGCVVAFLWGLLPGALRAYLGANELVSTLMLNEIALRIYSLILTAVKPASAGYIVSAQFAPEGLFPRFITGTRLSTAIGYVVIAVIAAWVILQRTPFGYQIRVIGANPNFARYGGIRTRRTIMLTMAVSAIFAGVAGAYLSMSVNQRLIANISGGLAFEGIVVALLARNNILSIPAMGLLYAYLRAGGLIIQNDAKVPLEVVNIIQAIIILLVTAEALAQFVRARRTMQQSPKIDPPKTIEPEAA